MLEVIVFDHSHVPGMKIQSLECCGSLPSKRPSHIFDYPMVCVYIHYRYKWLLLVSAHLPFFGPWLLDYGTTKSTHSMNVLSASGL